MADSAYRLVIGNKAWSSWSLRPWLVMRANAIAFEEINIRLREPQSKDEISKYSPSGKIPALIAGELAVWDSLAIVEFLAEAHPKTAIWPHESQARAIARSISAEMHSGFQALRQTCAMDLLARAPLQSIPDDVAADIRRIVSLWRHCRARFGAGGPYLFGAFSAADAMYAPVASRFMTYVPSLIPFGDDGTASAYADTIFAMPEMKEWANGARAQQAGM